MKVNTLFEVTPTEVKTHYTYHSSLNPKIWSGNTLKSKVSKKLTEIANTFIDSLKINDLEVEDIVILGSNTNYNWTAFSDLDLHIIIDVDEVKKSHGDLVEEYFQSKKKIFNDSYDITIYGLSVELYIQDSKERNISGGVYSIKSATWIKTPSYRPPSVNDDAVKQKTAYFMTEIDALTCHDIKTVNAIREKISQFRKSGLQTHGEYSVENLTFKTLRDNGYLEKLADCYKEATDKSLSLE